MREFHTFKFRNQNLMELGAVISQRPKRVSAAKDVEFVPIPHHNGDAFVDNKRYKNIAFEIPIRAVPHYCGLTFKQFSDQLIEWLRPAPYEKYRDTYNPGYFRLASVQEVKEIVAVKHDVYETSIVFNFMPFLYRDSGQFPITKFTDDANSITMELHNPEQWESDPIIKLIGSGQFYITVNGKNIAATVDEEITIDKITENFYDKNGNPCNQRISGLEIPQLEVGDNTIQVTRADATEGRITLQVIPNWGRL